MSPSTEPLERRMAEMGLTLATLTPAAAVELMIGLDAVEPSQHYITWYWGGVGGFGPDRWGLNMNRYWFPAEAPDDDRIEGSLTILLRYGADDESEEPPRGPKMMWYEIPARVDDLHASLAASPAFARLRDTPAEAVAFEIHDPSSHLHPVYDCWGHRDPSRPLIQMTEDEWLRCEDVPRMHQWLFDHWSGTAEELDGRLRRYYLACARRLLPLLPHEASRNGIDVAERYLDGRATREELGRAEFVAEGASFFLDQNSARTLAEYESKGITISDLNPEAVRDFAKVAGWVADVAKIPADDLASLLQTPGPGALSPEDLLSDAAGFVDSAMCAIYRSLLPQRSDWSRLRLFMPPALFREFVGNPFRRDAGLTAPHK